MKLKAGFADLFAIVLVLIIGLGALGYYAYKNGQIKLTTPVIAPTPTNTLEGSENLLFFKDEIFGISFLHPNYLIVDESAEGGGEESPTWRKLVIHNRDRTRDNYDLLWFDITAWDNPDNLTPEKWFAKTKSKFNEYITKISDLTIDGRTSAIYGVPHTCKSVSGFYILIQADDKILDISYASRNPSEEAIYNIETILKNFKFTIGDGTKENDIPKIVYPKSPENVVCN